MKAVLCRDFSQPLSYEEVAEPIPEAGQVVIAVKAIGINFADTLMVKGHYQVKPPLPFSPGFELAGEICACADDVKHLQIGQPVMAFVDYGAYAEQVVAPVERVMPIAAEMSFEHAAAFAVTYGTAHIALSRRAKLQANETLLVHGAAGGVGLCSVELGSLMGARVIATASSAAKLELCQRYGADQLINYQEADFVPLVKELTEGRGADVIVDPVGGEVFKQSLRCIAWEGRLLAIGFASGTIPQVPANLLLVKNCAVLGVYWGAYGLYQPEVLQVSLRQLLHWYSQGKLKPHISRSYPLEQATEALEELRQRRSRGKLILIPA